MLALVGLLVRVVDRLPAGVGLLVGVGQPDVLVLVLVLVRVFVGVFVVRVLLVGVLRVRHVRGLVGGLVALVVGGVGPVVVGLVDLVLGVVVLGVVVLGPVELVVVRGGGVLGVVVRLGPDGAGVVGAVDRLLVLVPILGGLVVLVVGGLVVGRLVVLVGRVRVRAARAGDPGTGLVGLGVVGGVVGVPVGRGRLAGPGVVGGCGDVGAPGRLRGLLLVGGGVLDADLHVDPARPDHEVAAEVRQLGR